MLKQMFEITGMMRDLDPSKLNSKYAYEIRNLRLTAQEDTTMLALVSEKGNARYNIVDSDGEPYIIEGDVIGYCTLHDYIVLFTHKNSETPDRIYRLEVNNMNMIAVLLYSGNLGFHEGDNNIESIGIYENEYIQKVYWIDGVHQPRFINIVAKDISKWNDDSFDFVPLLTKDETVIVSKTSFNGMFGAGTIQYFLTYYNRNGQESAVFYQSPLNYIAQDNKGNSPEDTVNNAFNIRIYNPNNNFDYVRVYSVFRSSENGVAVCKKVHDIKVNDILQETKTYKIFSITTSSPELDLDSHAPFYVIDLDDICIVDNDYNETDINKFLLYRNGENSYYSISSDYNMFVINRLDPLHSISRAQAYSGQYLNIHITGNSIIYIDGVSGFGGSTFRYWGNVSTEQSTRNITYNYIECIDNGISNEVVDYGEIIYAGGANIIPSTMATKNNTLFFGNYKSTTKISEENKDIIKNNSAIYFGYSKDGVYKGEIGSFYMYHNQFDNDAKKITTFKGGETYHFGIILQDSRGIWTDVIPIGEATNNYYPNDNDYNYFYPVKAYIHFNDEALNIINNYISIKVVRLDTLPSVVAQGVLCPTVFNKYRNQNAPYSIASWYFRDIKPDYENALIPHHIQNLHNGNIIDGISSGGDLCIESIGEIQGSKHDKIGFYDYNVDYSTFNDTDMFVDWNTLTLNSPDIEFGQIPTSYNYHMRIVGITPITSCITSMTLTWDTAIPGIDEIFEYDKIIRNNIDTDAYQIELNNFIFKAAPENNPYLFPIYPWHNNGSIIGQTEVQEGYDDLQGLLGRKIMASLRGSATTRYAETQSYDITKMKIYYDDDALLLLDEDKFNPLFNEKKIYAGSRDLALVNGKYTTWEKDYGTIDPQIRIVSSNCTAPVRMQYRTTTHGVFSLKSINENNKNHMYILPNVAIGGDILTYEHQDIANKIPRDRIKAIIQLTSNNVITLNNNVRVSPDLEFNVPNITHGDGCSDDLTFTLQITNVFNYTPSGVGEIVMISGSNLNGYPHLDNMLYAVISRNPTTGLLRLKTLGNNINFSPIGYYSLQGSVDYTRDNEYDYTEGQPGEEGYFNETIFDVYFKFNDVNTVKYYKSTVYFVNEYISDEGLSELVNFSYAETGQCILICEVPVDNNKIYQNTYNIDDVNVVIDNKKCSYMYLAELYMDNINTNYENAPWYVASEPIKTGAACIEASIGDTYFQRYDCLKTYPSSLENQNSIVEIFSFMCETKVNIDGRYDNRRGLSDNTTNINTNFNQINKAYTQNDNFITYQYLDPDAIYIDEFPNEIVWTMTKVYGSDVDNWTKILPTSTLDMDGNLGKVRALKMWNDHLLCFQDMGIAHIMYNERTTITTTQGVPIEIANSNKVDGKQYISTQIGCTNKDSIQLTSNGVYFIDSNTKDIYRWKDNLKSLSKDKGFNAYMQKDTSCLNTEKTFYDPKLQDVYFRFADEDKTECLVFNEQIDEFTSFFDYDMDYMFSFKDNLIAVGNDGNSLWKQFAGEYLRFFDEEDDDIPVYKDYTIQLVSAEHPTIEKIFTNMEFRADVLDGSITDVSQDIADSLNPNERTNICPFNTLKVWNEYQNTGDVPLERLLRKGSNMSQKFRIWRTEIGRDKVDKLHIFNRIRSPWARIQIKGGGSNMKTVIHDIAVCYV